MLNKKKVILICFVFSSLTLWADDLRKTKSIKPVNKKLVSNLCKGCELVNVSLNGLINEVVKRNYTLYSKKIKVNMSEHKILLEDGIFEPNLKISSSYSRKNVPNSAEESLSRGFLDNYRDRVRDTEVSLSGLLESGGEWTIGFTDRKKGSNLISETQDYGIEYSDGLNISFKQPLLRGMGKDVTHAKINMSKIEKEISSTEYKNELMNLIATTIKIYWRLYGAQKLYENWAKTLKITNGQLKNIRLLAEYGKVPESEILEMESSIFQKRTELLGLKSTIFAIQNQLLSLLNLSSAGFNTTLFIAKDTPSFNHKKTLLNVDKSYQKALEHLPELKLAHLKVESGRLEKKYNENQLLPDLSVNSSISTLGLSDIQRNALYCSTGCEDQYSWSVGISLELPLYGNKMAKERLKISKLSLQNSELEIDSFHNDIYNAVNTKIGQLKIERFKLNEYIKEIVISKKLLSIEHEKLKLGEGRIRDVLEYEAKFMNVQRKMLSSIVNYKVAEALLNKATGELLSNQNIQFSFNNYKRDSKKLNIKSLNKR
jgi:outer membrane protein TolC